MSGIVYADSRIKFLVFNTQIHAPEDVAVGSHIKGTVTFDATHEIVLDDVQIKLECLEVRLPVTKTRLCLSACIGTDPLPAQPNVQYKFRESPIVTTESHADSSASAKKLHRLKFLDHFKKHGKAPTATVTKHAAHESHAYPYETKFEIVTTILPASKVKAPFAPGHLEFSFEIALSADAPLTVAIPKANGEVDLVLYRLHATVKAQGETTHTVCQ
ncbi:hypothetical protein BC830DRAFT_1076539 [Chytriomyces sp. MP71]|nr:hypothetical protein BC830DRAFT_1076539 [Chytriomyces sp. MP71]